MITFMTRKSILDTAVDLQTPELAAMATQSRALLFFMVYDDNDDRNFQFSEDNPSIRMWSGYEVALAAYSAGLTLELASRGVVLPQEEYSAAWIIKEMRRRQIAEFVRPPWFEDIDVLSSHRSNAQRRWPDRYADTWKGVPQHMPYIYPFVDEDGGYGLFISKQEKELLAKGERTLSKSVTKRIENL